MYKPILNKLGQCKCKLASYPGCSKKINRCKCRSKTTPKRMYLNGEGCPECCCEDQGRNQCTTASTTTVTTKVTTTVAASTTALDVEVPTLTCTITAVAASSPTFTFAENVTFKVEASDNSDAVDVVCSPPNGVNRFEVGRTDIVCNATDPAGNFASCSFQVMITDPRSPACAGATTGDSCAIGSLQDSVIPNPSFEERSGCPSGFGQGGQNDGLGFANDWVQATSATSDYFNGGTVYKQQRLNIASALARSETQRAPVTHVAFATGFLRRRRVPQRQELGPKLVWGKPDGHACPRWKCFCGDYLLPNLA